MAVSLVVSGQHPLSVRTCPSKAVKELVQGQKGRAGPGAGPLKPCILSTQFYAFEGNAAGCVWARARVSKLATAATVTFLHRYSGCLLLEPYLRPTGRLSGYHATKPLRVAGSVHVQLPRCCKLSAGCLRFCNFRLYRD